MDFGQGIQRPADDRDILAAKFEIEVEETLHLKNLYKMIYEWLLEEGYTDGWMDEGTHFESLYFERILPQGSKEHHIWWRCIYYPHYPHGKHPYVRYFLKIDYQTLYTVDQEILKFGHKFKTNLTNVILRIEGWVQLDYKSEWKKHWLLSQFDDVFRKRIYFKRAEVFKYDLYNTAYRLNDTIKQYLKLKTPSTKARHFWPEGGVG
ncbi:MAG: hypothetical protein ABIH41_05165 [Nanoarchaeota archaeon]